MDNDKPLQSFLQVLLRIRMTSHLFSESCARKVTRVFSFDFFSP